MEVADENIKTLTMDHHGLVAATCKDLGIAEKIKNKIGNKDERRLSQRAENSSNTIYE